jgi:hypothetical protein
VRGSSKTRTLGYLRRVAFGWARASATGPLSATGQSGTHRARRGQQPVQRDEHLVPARRALLWAYGCCSAFEWAKRQALKAGIGFTDLANGFASCDDPAGLQEICDRLQAGTIEVFAQRWLHRIPMPSALACRVDQV